jgi:hypothetical protein
MNVSRAKSSRRGRPSAIHTVRVSYWVVVKCPPGATYSRFRVDPWAR